MRRSTRAGPTISSSSLAPPAEQEAHHRAGSCTPVAGSRRRSAARWSSSAAWLRACAESTIPASIRDSSATRGSPATGVTVATVRPPLLLLLDDHLCVREGGDLREVGHAEHLVPPTEVGEEATDRGAGLTPDPGVDLVEHQRRRRLREHEAQRQHRTGELAAGRGPGERSCRLARVRARAGR